MILTFNPRFIEPIKHGTKIHTIRRDENDRWKPGIKIHLWCGNPRNVSKNPYQFQMGICTKVSFIQMDFVNDTAVIDCKFQDIHEIAKNDGFEDWWDLKKWFRQNGEEFFFSGKLIYFKVHATI